MLLPVGQLSEELVPQLSRFLRGPASAIERGQERPTPLLTRLATWSSVGTGRQLGGVQMGGVHPMLLRRCGWGKPRQPACLDVRSLRPFARRPERGAASRADHSARRSRRRSSGPSGRRAGTGATSRSTGRSTAPDGLPTRLRRDDAHCRHARTKFTCSATSDGGETTKSVTIKIDKTRTGRCHGAPTGRPTRTGGTTGRFTSRSPGRTPRPGSRRAQPSGTRDPTIPRRR